MYFKMAFQGIARHCISKLNLDIAVNACIGRLEALSFSRSPLQKCEHSLNSHTRNNDGRPAAYKKERSGSARLSG